MTTARTSHPATPLPDGDVLIVGGFPGENAGVTAAAELFDTATTTMRRIDSLSTPRGGHASAVRADGRVLVVTGGQVAPGQATGRAAVFDPDGGTWSTIAPMGTPRMKHVAVDLADGRVLIAGGTSDDQTLLATTELFDPDTGRFAPGPELREGRYKLPGGALAIDSSHVIFAAGGRTVEVLDLVNGTSTTIGDLGSRAPFATLSRLLDDRLLVLGGYDDRIALHRQAIVVDLTDLDLRQHEDS